MLSDLEKKKAFDEFYERTHTVSYRFLRAIRFLENDIQEVLSRSYEIAWKRFDEYIALVENQYWFYGILRNQSNYYKSVLSKKDQRTEALEIEAADYDTPETDFLKKEDRNDFYAVIVSLPANYREVVLLRLQSYSYKEISKLLDISESAAESRMRRALVKLEEPFTDFLKRRNG